GMDLAEAVRSLTGGDSPRGVLARVMQQQDRDVELPVWAGRVTVPLPHTLCGTAFRGRCLLRAGARRARSGTSVRAARAGSVARAPVRPRSGRFSALFVVFVSVRSAPGSMHSLIKSGADASSAGDR